MENAATAARTTESVTERSRSRHRILYIEANEDGTVGGSHQILFDLVVNIDRSRFEPVVLFYQDNIFAARLRAQGIEVHLYDGVRAKERAIRSSGNRLAKLAEYAVTVVRRFRFLRDHRIDLIHINNSPRVGNDDWLPAARLLGRPCVASVMGDARGPVGGWIHRRLFRSFDRYVPLSEYLAAAMRRADVDPGRIDLVYPGVDLESFRKRVQRTPADVRNELGVREGTLLGVMVGNIREWKGQHVVIAALELVAPEERARLRIAFAGAARPEDQSYVDAMTAAIKRAGLSQQVVFLGSRRDIPDLLNAADFALHASVKPEPFGLVVIEAMALGKPIVAAETGGPAEIVSTDSGVLFDPAKPRQLAEILSAFLRDPGRRHSLAAGATERVSRFTVQGYVTGVERVYQRLVRPRPAPPARL